MAGTGGSGVALTRNMGCNVLSASGTTGTTNRTRAVAFTTALAKYWKIKYMPVIGNTGENAASKAEGNIWKRINFRGIMMTSLPAFIAWHFAWRVARFQDVEVCQMYLIHL